MQKVFRLAGIRERGTNLTKEFVVYAFTKKKKRRGRKLKKKG